LTCRHIEAQAFTFAHCHPYPEFFTFPSFFRLLLWVFLCDNFAGWFACWGLTKYYATRQQAKHIHAHLLREYVYSMGYKTPSQFVTPIPLELVNIFGWFSWLMSIILKMEFQNFCHLLPLFFFLSLQVAELFFSFLFFML